MYISNCMLLRISTINCIKCQIVHKEFLVYSIIFYFVWTFKMYRISSNKGQALNTSRVKYKPGLEYRPGV